MKRPRAFLRIQKRYEALSRARRELAPRSNDALSDSKRAIFALHREDDTGASELLARAQSQFEAIEHIVRSFPELQEEGSYRAALEEYAEARLFAGYLKTGTLAASDSRLNDVGIFLAGLCDATGELVRYATRQVTLGHPQTALEARETVAMVVEFLLNLDLTGYLRTKFDQAKKNLDRLEQMTYDLAIRERSKV